MKHSLKKLISSNKTTLFDITLILLLGLLPLSWFKKNLLIYGPDFTFPLAAPPKVLLHYFYSWNNTNAPGIASLGNFTQIPFQAFLVVLDYLGLSMVAIEKIYFVIFLSSAGLSMYYLTSTLIEGEKRRLAALTSAFFYMFNPFFMNIIWHRLLLLPIYTISPLILALYIKGLRQRAFLFYSLLIGLVTIVVSSANGNPVFSVATFIIMLSYLLFFLLDKRKDRKEVINALKFTGFLTLVLLGLNMWWILPRFSLIFDEFTNATKVTNIAGLSNFSFLDLNSRTSSLINVFRLQGYWAFYDGYKGDSYYTYAAALQTNPYQLIGFLIPLLAFTILLRKQRNLHIFYFVSLAVTGLFLIKGLQPPAGKVYLWFFENFPLLQVFRNFYDKFGIIVTLSYSFLIGITISSIYQSLTKTFSGKKTGAVIFLGTTIIILFGVYAFPFWTGEVIPKGGKVIPPAHVRMPGYYYQANNWLKNQKKFFTIFPLPFPKLSYAAYNWKNGYWGPYPNWLFSKPTISSYTGPSYDFPLKTAEIIHKKSSPRVGKVLALLNVKYILFHRDTNWQFVEGNNFWISTTSRRYDRILKNQHGLHLTKSFGNLDFYRNEYYKPSYIYGASKFSLVKNDFNKMLKTIGQDNFEVGKSLTLFADQLNAKQLSDFRKRSQSNSEKEPKIKFKNINPTKKVIQVKSEAPFFLVFSESYHPGWKAYIRPVRSQESGVNSSKSAIWQGWFRKPLPEEKHFRANGYANSWFIDKKGRYKIFLEFTPQRYFYWGLGISLTTLGLILFFLLKNVNYHFRTKQN